MRVRVLAALVLGALCVGGAQSAGFDLIEPVAGAIFCNPVDHHEHVVDALGVRYARWY
jgi:hypothetical protein